MQQHNYHSILVFHIGKHTSSWHLFSLWSLKLVSVCMILPHLLSITPARCSGGECHPHLTIEGTGS